MHVEYPQDIWRLNSMFTPKIRLYVMSELVRSLSVMVNIFIKSIIQIRKIENLKIICPYYNFKVQMIPTDFKLHGVERWFEINTA